MIEMSKASAQKRVLLKLSGEALMGSDSYGINSEVIKRIVTSVKEIFDTGIQLAIVIGGGNIFRGVANAAKGMDRATADNMGMMATAINALSLSDAMRQQEIPARVMSAFNIESVIEPFVRGRAINHLAKGRAVIFAGGTGNPFFTTDTAACLRALEIGADVVLKATKVDGVYDKDPVKHKDAIRYDSLSFDEVLNKRLGVMDATAIALCRENNLPLCVFDINKAGAMMRVVSGQTEGTWVRS